MPPIIEVHGRDSDKLYAAVDVDTKAPANTVAHIGNMLLDLVAMGNIRSESREELIVTTSADK